jgi:gamma-glutamyltranspeptidase/glutathione hydrolase
LEKVRADGIEGKELPLLHPHTVTVPGAAAGWVDALDKFGTITIDKALAPAIKLAEEGFPVHQLAAHGWKNGTGCLLQPGNTHGKDMLKPDGTAPKEGEVMRLPLLAATFRELVRHSTDAKHTWW